ncbi:MAG: D-alanyl-D-alanine carboxypeptidase, partial [Leptolyngbya sp. SIO4C1]|nr:D-alanyl-D-alanine carboxypeptidase [Leptolyngbya sp. SIO4C1]
MVQVSLSTTTSFDGDLNALVEDLGTALTVRFDLDEPAPAGGLKVYLDSDIEQILNRLDLPAAIANPQAENLNLLATQTNFDNSGLALEITEGSTFATVTLNVFDNPEPDTTLPETFDGRVDAVLSLVTADQIATEDQGSITGLGDYTVDPDAASSTVIFVDEAGQLEETPPPEPPTTPEPPTPEPPASDALQVSLFTGPDYLIEDEGTVSAHAFLATNGVIPEGGLVVSVDAPNLSEFDLEGISVEGGEIEAVRDGGFDLRMMEYTTLVNLPIADDGETETEETATFSLAAGEGYEIVEDYSGGTFSLVDTASDIPRGVVTEPNDIVSAVVTSTEITPENPSFSAASSLYFDIGNRYLNEDGTYTYIDYNEDVDLYQVELSTGDTIAIETFEVEGNGLLETAINVFDTEGNRLSYASDLATAAPDKLFGTPEGTFNEDGTVNENQTDNYLEFTAPEDGIYYVGLSELLSGLPGSFGEDVSYSITTPGLGENNRATGIGNYEIEIDLLTEDNPRKTGTPTPPVSNPDVTNPPTLSLSANPTTVDGEGNFTNAVVEFVEDDGISGITFTIQAEGEIPEEGIEIVLNSNANLLDYVGLFSRGALPSTIGGQSLGAFYNEDGIPTGIRLRVQESTMTVNLERTNRSLQLADELDFESLLDKFEGLETDGPEDVTFFLQ